MKIKFYRYLSEDADIVLDNYGDMRFSEACILQLRAEIAEQDSELAAMITFGEFRNELKTLDQFDTYTIDATMDQVVPIERIQAVYDLGVAGRFEIIS